MNLAILWQYVCAWWYQLRSILGVLVLQCCVLGVWLLIGYVTYRGLTWFFSGDIQLGMLCTAGDVALVRLYGALLRVRNEKPKRTPGKHTTEPAEEQQTEPEEDDSASWQTEAERVSTVVDNSIDYDADTRDGASEIAQSVDDLRAADDSALMDELRRHGLLSDTLSPEAAQLISSELQAFRRLTKGLQLE